MKISIDTNIFLNVKNKEQPFYSSSKSILQAIDNQENDIQAIISIIIITELTVGYYLNNELLEKNEFLSRLYANKKFTIVEYDLQISDKAAEIRSKIGLKLPDCIIIASALIGSSEILITNDSGFDKAKGLIKIYSSEAFFDKYLSVK